MSSRLYSLCVDAREPGRLARFWAEALGEHIIEEEEDEVAVAADEHSYPVLLFLSVPESKTIKNRLHIDLNPDDQAAEVQRLIGLGATHAGVGQQDVSWVVLADPEGNEFCVLTAREQD